MARWVSWNCLRLVMLTGYLGARAKRLCLCLWRRSCGSSRGSESRGLSSSREARAASATASFVRRPCVAAWSDPACDNGGLHMPKVAVRPLRSSSYRFPHASPVSTSGAGKQEAAPEDRFKPLISSRKFGAGEGIRTLDPNLGKVMSNVLGADGGTRTRTLREKQIFLPLRLSPPPFGVRGLDCPFAMASRPKAPPVQSLHLPSIEGLARDWPGARAR